MISFHDLKNYIINDPLSDWFTKINALRDSIESGLRNVKVKKEVKDFLIIFTRVVML